MADSATTFSRRAVDGSVLVAEWKLMREREFIGIMPAAGLGSRLNSLSCPKELLPVAFLSDPITGVTRPILAAEHALHSMRQAGVTKCLLVINDRKPEILRYFGNGSEAGISIAYVNQPIANGLAAAVDSAFDWCCHANVCLALPDTVFTPSNAIAVVNKTLLEEDADLVLGVFPTNTPQSLGPVRSDSEERVVEVLEKPSSTDLHNTWGIAAWSPRFSAFLHRPAEQLHSLSIGSIFHEAVVQGMNVRSVSFEHGSYVDLGTGESLAAMIFGRWRDTNGVEEAFISHA